VTHACNPDYQEAEIKRTAVQSQPRTNSSRDPILKKPVIKKGWWSGSTYRPRVQVPVPKKKKEGHINRISRVHNHWRLTFFFYSAQFLGNSSKLSSVSVACIFLLLCGRSSGYRTLRFVLPFNARVASELDGYLSCSVCE
jgi:hypothetical protein